jgi:hypothetical protein
MAALSSVSSSRSSTEGGLLAKSESMVSFASSGAAINPTRVYVDFVGADADLWTPNFSVLDIDGT